MSSGMLVATICLALLAMHATATCNTPPRPDRRCGPKYGDAACARPQECCSVWGYCGDGPKWCNEQSACPSAASLECQSDSDDDYSCASSEHDPEEYVHDTTKHEPEHTDREPEHTDREPEHTDREPEHTDREPEHTDREPEHTDREPEHKEHDNNDSERKLRRSRDVVKTVRGVSTLNWCGPNKLVALTFDDSAFTEPAFSTLLSDLKTLNMKATFFLCPKCYFHVESEYCASVQRLIDDGHSIQGHTMNHFSSMTLSDEQLGEEIKGVETYLLNKCGIHRPFTMFRPPFGEFDRHRAELVNGMGYTIASWNADSGDSHGLVHGEIISRLDVAYKNVYPGSLVILMHEFNYTPGKLQGVLHHMSDNFDGYSYVTMDKCFANCIATGSCENVGGDNWPGVFATQS